MPKGTWRRGRTPQGRPLPGSGSVYVSERAVGFLRHEAASTGPDALDGLLATGPLGAAHAAAEPGCHPSERLG